MPALIIFALFVGVPLAEIAVFISVGGLIGLWPTIAIVVITAIIGTALLRRQGAATMMKAQEAMRAGQPPIGPALDGVALLVAGALLLTPGMITDSIGFLLFVPPVRRGLAKWVFSRLMRRAEVRFSYTESRSGPGAPGGSPRGGPRASGAKPAGHGSGPTIIDGDYERLDDPKGAASPGGRGSPWRTG